MDKIAELLQQSETFNKLPAAECAKLINTTRPRRLKKGDFLCHEGDVWPYIIFVLQGELRWTILSAAGREYVLFTIKRGRVFLGHSIFDNSPMPASLVAAKDCLLYQWPREVILPVLYRNPDTLWQICGKLVRTMRQAREIIYGLAFRPVASRLACLLIDQFPAQDDPTVERNLTLSDMASMVGSSPEVICRLLQQFHADGLLEITRASFTLRDRTSLESLADDK